MAALTDLAGVLVRRVCRVPDFEMRVAILREEVVEAAPELSIELMAILLREAEARAEPYVEALPALMTALSSAAEERREVFAQLARERGHDAVARMVRPSATAVPGGEPEARIPDYGKGRPLTLGERKSIARRPRRDLIERALGDPHPEVIRLLLQNPRLTEADVIRICARRPCPPEVLLAVSRAQRWAGRARVRSALVRNPNTPPGLALQLVSLLLRQELREVAQSSEVDPAVRAACNELLRAKPPAPDESDTIH